MPNTSPATTVFLVSPTDRRQREALSSMPHPPWRDHRPASCRNGRQFKAGLPDLDPRGLQRAVRYLRRHHEWQPDAERQLPGQATNVRKRLCRRGRAATEFLAALRPPPPGQSGHPPEPGPRVLPLDRTWPYLDGRHGQRATGTFRNLLASQSRCRRTAYAGDQRLALRSNSSPPGRYGPCYRYENRGRATLADRSPGGRNPARRACYSGGAPSEGSRIVACSMRQSSICQRHGPPGPKA